MSDAAALLLLSRALHACTTLEDAIERVRDAIVAHTRYRRAYLHLIAPDQKTFEIVGWVLPDRERMRQRLATIDVSQDRLLQRGFAARDPFVIPDLRLDPDADQAQVEFFGNRTIIGVPLFDGDARIGPFVVPTYADQGVCVPTEDELAFIIQVASLLAVVISRMRAEDARRALEDRVAAADRLGALGRMAGEIAHDFNNVLVTILANTELALDDATSAAQRACLEDVRDAAIRAGTFSRQLLASARGQLIVREHVDLPALIRRVERIFRPTMPAGRTLHCSVADDLGTVPADAVQLERVLLNLAINARDALEPGGRVDLEAALTEVEPDSVGAQPGLAPGRYAVITVADTGIGIPEAIRARVFEPFFTTKSEGGTGLGLSVVDGVVRQHGGTLHLDSETGRGTTVRVFLPLDEPVVRDRTATVRPIPDATRVLVVDDDAQVLRTVQRILDGLCRVTACARGDLARELLDTQEFDVLVSDVVLPGLDGVALAAAARAAQPDIGVLLMTGHARGKLVDADQPFLAKPFAPRDLVAAVGAVLPARV